MDGLHNLRWYDPVTWLFAMAGLFAVLANVWARKWCYLFGHRWKFLYEIDATKSYQCRWCRGRRDDTSQAR